ncbi:hypothetical protein ACP5YT_003222 [Cronobacter malonaticus]|uniref:hypothetical protein n=1 Tax=Cronobacter malonaticus TaxID=413503 RepID=UPI00138ACD74|nr:hypothetical protein [Cronobacter malonaticus]ELY4445969.1 hypothetical protein [Cronobacter malonaticus]ELY4491366.1 hypothetical protein [Cronobacter malonaticus]ELY6296920.1 hypothetical protein [Cronobacter malonaticus]ELY6318188.1 hypothetical protein [Cronobacter malonaticus]
MDIETLIAAASRAQQDSEHKLGTCSCIWHIHVSGISVSFLMAWVAILSGKRRLINI